MLHAYCRGGGGGFFFSSCSFSSSYLLANSVFSSSAEFAACHKFLF